MSNLFLTNEAMCIGKFGEATGEFFNSTNRALYREKLKEFQLHSFNMCMHLYGKLGAGHFPDYVFVWKSHMVHLPTHTGLVSKVIRAYHAITPNMMK